MGFFPREFMLRKVRHHNFYELADKLESVSLLALFGGRRKEGELSLDTLEDVLELGRGRGISNLDKKARITRPAPLI